MTDLDQVAEPDTALRRRTRRAIVDAAVHLWARDFSTPLATVAHEAGVSRSTLHRYFADKHALVDGCLAVIEEVFPSESTATGGTALDRLIADLDVVLPLGDWVLFLWSDPNRFADHPAGAELWGDDGMEPVKALIAQGQAQGDLDPEAPADWLLSIYYSVLYCAAESIVNNQLTIPEASRLAGRALRRGIAP